jgi:hypothetical protein
VRISYGANSALESRPTLLSRTARYEIVGGRVGDGSDDFLLSSKSEVTALD